MEEIVLLKQGKWYSAYFKAEKMVVPTAIDAGTPIEEARDRIRKLNPGCIVR